MRGRAKRRSLKGEAKVSDAEDAGGASSSKPAFHNSTNGKGGQAGTSRAVNPKPSLPSTAIRTAPTVPSIRPDPSQPSDQANGRGVEAEMDVDDAEDDAQGGGRGMRVKKKRRLSAAGMIDPNTVDANGTLLKPRKRQPRPSELPLPVSAPSYSRSTESAAPPLSLADQAYANRELENSMKPQRTKMKGPCPVWAKTRRALLSTLEYMQNPRRVEGGSVEIGSGGIARGIILEGVAPGQGTYWGVGKEAGTIVTCL
jgi:hypothetical protein